MSTVVINRAPIIHSWIDECFHYSRDGWSFECWLFFSDRHDARRIWIFAFDHRTISSWYSVEFFFISTADKCTTLTGKTKIVFHTRMKNRRNSVFLRKIEKLICFFFFFQFLQILLFTLYFPNTIKFTNVKEF